MQSRLSLKQARVIEAVAIARGFDEASRILNMSQPVVSRTVASAENLLGATLFQRGWSGTEPTVWGDTILQRCSAALKHIARAEADIVAIGNTRPNLTPFLRWHHLDAVSAVIRFGSASAASVHLGMAQPAISRSLSAISEYCRQSLFERRRNGLEASPQARRLAALRDELLQELSLDNIDLEPRRGLVGRLAVGMLPFSGQDLVARAFGYLTNRYPHLRLIAVPGSYNMLTEALRRGEIDCMIGILRSPTPFPELEEIFLYNERFTLVARQAHPCHARGVTISDLQKERWIVAPHGTPVRSYFGRLFESVGAVPPAQTCEILSFSNAEQVIINSNSIGLLSYSDQHIASLPPSLKKVNIDLPDSETPIGLTVKRTEGSSEILEIFTGLLRNLCSQGGSTPLI
ncbi:LysR family transcriptional regulator [Chelativorans salis]|uniref:LysR family transcriptional regulator n=1 Tax=Chelativorans salis TaxID=2978478 RepID=A0ABT2LTD6_9HYPH|nr:LysR family transcriptional regulator [Chelativorans sp. EGI FJ00035]MCT7376638.1 LysR family transcriptional regulator [Chelativorans sp. EGI FJ00035]